MLEIFLRFTSLFLCLIVLLVVFSQNRKIYNTFNDFILDRLYSSTPIETINDTIYITITLNENGYSDSYNVFNVGNNYIIYIIEEGY